MKKKKVCSGIIILLLIGLNLIAQEKFTTYDNIYVQKTYDIQIHYADDEKFTLYIDALSLDDFNSVGGFMVNDKRYQDFVIAINDAKSKFMVWKQTAKENNIKDLDKKMPIKCRIGGYFLYGNDWHFQHFINLTFDFKILENDGNVKYLLIVRSGEMRSSSNEYIDVDGIVLIFTTTKEIDNFLESISLENINNFRNKPKPEDLFK